MSLKYRDCDAIIISQKRNVCKWNRHYPSWAFIGVFFLNRQTKKEQTDFGSQVTLYYTNAI